MAAGEERGEDEKAEEVKVEEDEEDVGRAVDVDVDTAAAADLPSVKDCSALVMDVTEVMFIDLSYNICARRAEEAEATGVGVEEEEKEEEVEAGGADDACASEDAAAAVDAAVEADAKGVASLRPCKAAAFTTFHLSVICWDDKSD